MPESKIRTSLDSLVNLVNKFGKVKFQDAAKALDMDEASLEELVKILSENKIVEIHYSIVGDKIIKKGEKLEGAVSKEEISRHVEETLSEEELKKAKETEKVEQLLDVMKQRISERKKEKVFKPAGIEERLRRLSEEKPETSSIEEENEKIEEKTEEEFRQKEKEFERIKETEERKVQERYGKEARKEDEERRKAEELIKSEKKREKKTDY